MADILIVIFVGICFVAGIVIAYRLKKRGGPCAGCSMKDKCNRASCDYIKKD